MAEKSRLLQAFEAITNGDGTATPAFQQKWQAVVAGPPKYAVAGLPTSSDPTKFLGSLAYATDLRVFNGTGTRETAGHGTGGLVTHNGTNWVVAGTNVTAAA